VLPSPLTQETRKCVRFSLSTYLQTREHQLERRENHLRGRAGGETDGPQVFRQHVPSSHELHHAPAACENTRDWSSHVPVIQEGRTFVVE
jgi:hypothetical protein